MNPPPPSGPQPGPLDENDLLAADYALGVLGGRDLARAEAMVKDSSAFAARVAAWEARLAPMADAVSPVEAPNLFPQIEARLFGAQPRRAAWR